MLSTPTLRSLTLIIRVMATRLLDPANDRSHLPCGWVGHGVRRAVAPEAPIPHGRGLPSSGGSGSGWARPVRRGQGDGQGIPQRRPWIAEDAVVAGKRLFALRRDRPPMR